MCPAIAIAFSCLWYFAANAARSTIASGRRTPIVLAIAPSSHGNRRTRRVPSLAQFLSNRCDSPAESLGDQCHRSIAVNGPQEVVLQGLSDSTVAVQPAPPEVVGTE